MPDDAYDANGAANGVRGVPPAVNPFSKGGHHSEPPTAVCVRGDVIVMQDPDGYPFTVENSTYNHLRYVDYAGRRITYKFQGSVGGGSDGASEAAEDVVEETYTPGIFNCRSGDKLVQISDTAAVMQAIIDDDRAGYRGLCSRWYSMSIQHEYIETYIRGSSRLSHDKAGKKFLVDGGIFAVSYKANAMFAQDEAGARRWVPLCIVNTESRREQTLCDPQMGRITITEMTQMIIGKLMFLLHPARDQVFLEQLTGKALKHAEMLIDARRPDSTYDAGVGDADLEAAHSAEDAAVYRAAAHDAAGAVQAADMRAARPFEAEAGGR